MRKRRSVALVAVFAALFGLFSLVSTPLAGAHGGMTSPATRTYVCYLEGPESPDTAPCKDAVAQGGTQPLYDWFAVLISNAAGRHRELIPDGQLCGAGTTKYAAYNMPRADWPATTLTPGVQHNFRYRAWAPHPGTFDLYVTRDGYDPTQPLKWSDLEATPFLSVTNPPIVDGDYSWTGSLPAAKSGRHLIYSIWQRSDSPEAFYNCSDVIFSGGQPDTAAPTAPGTPVASQISGSGVKLSWAASSDDVGVTGYRVYREAGATDELVASSATTSATLTGLTPQTAYSFYVVALDAAGHTSSPSTPVSVTTTNNPATGNCTVAYTTPSVWSGGFTGHVKITNTGTTALSGWSVVWDFTGNEQVTSSWSTQLTQSGTRVTAGNVEYNRSIAAGGSAEFGFNASSSTAPVKPAVFTVNGVGCAMA